jgi:hypothetical protein
MRFVYLYSMYTAANLWDWRASLWDWHHRELRTNHRELGTWTVVQKVGTWTEPDGGYSDIQYIVVPNSLFPYGRYQCLERRFKFNWFFTTTHVLGNIEFYVHAQAHVDGLNVKQKRPPILFLIEYINIFSKECDILATLTALHNTKSNISGTMVITK